MVNDCIVLLRSLLTHNASNKPILKPIQIALLLFIFGFNPENSKKVKEKIYGAFQITFELSKNRTVLSTVD